MAVFLVGVMLVGWAMPFGRSAAEEDRGILGGPAGFSPAGNEPLFIALESQPAIIVHSLNGGVSLEEDDPLVEVVPGGIADPGQPIAPASRGDLLVYTVQSGDTLSGIAAYFGVSIETIVNANPGVRARFIKPGDELNILPVSGVVYTAKSGDTVESISAYFSVAEEKIIQFNEGIDLGDLGAGVSLIIPGAKSYRTSRAGADPLSDFGVQLIKPADGFNWGKLHKHNAIDIANSCGTSVLAASDGLVVPDESFGDGLEGWNGGYGRFVLIEHPFGDGVRTRYAHLAEVGVTIGDYVEQGSVIGEIGRSGDATGCHVHFEVLGAANPFAR